jgi:hypothetical protein
MIFFALEDASTEGDRLGSMSPAPRLPPSPNPEATLWPEAILDFLDDCIYK